LPAHALLAAFLLPVIPAGAQMSEPAPTFTPQQRSEIVAVVREALKSDPSILRDAVGALRADDGRIQEAAARAAISASTAQLNNAPGDPVAGNPDGDVTVVEFYDVRCPYCRRMLPAIDQLLATDKGVRLILKDLPILGPGSILGSRALLAAQRQGGYLKLQRAIMRGPADVTDASLQNQAEANGLDWTRLQRDMADPAIQTRIDANLALAHTLNIEGTPALIVGTKLIPGAVDFAALQKAVKEARK